MGRSLLAADRRARHRTGQEEEVTFADVTVVPVAESRKEDFEAFPRRMAEIHRDQRTARIIDFS